VEIGKEGVHNTGVGVEVVLPNSILDFVISMVSMLPYTLQFFHVCRSLSLIVALERER
jgi:hypothetical protein